MFRKFVCAAIILALGVSAGLSADKTKTRKKKGAFSVGTVKKIDRATGAVTVAVKVARKKIEDKDFTLGEGVKIVVFADNAKKELTGKDGLQEIKEGGQVTLISDAEGKLTEVRVGSPRKGGLGAKKAARGKPVVGSVQKLTGETLRLSVPKIVTEDKDFPIDDSVRVIVFSGNDKKELTGKDGLKEIKEGSRVSVRVDAGGKVIAVVVGNPPRRFPLKKKEGTPTPSDSKTTPPKKPELKPADPK